MVYLVQLGSSKPFKSMAPSSGIFLSGLQWKEGKKVFSIVK